VIYRGAELARTNLANGAAEATLTLPLGATISVAYDGDAYYGFSSQEARVATRQRTIRH
jgi:hypothetical protein